MASPSSILSALLAWLKEEGITAQEDPSLHALRLGFTGEHGQWVCLALADEERQLARFYSIAPFVVPADRRAATNEYVTRVNFGMPVGAFELDLDDGEVRFKTSLALGGASASADLLAGLVWPNVAAMDRWIPGLIAVAQQGLDVDKALTLGEG